MKELLVTAPIIRPSNWDLQFEIICDANNHAMGKVLGQIKDRVPHIIYYALKTIDHAQHNYPTVEELLVLVFAMEKFRQYLLSAKIVIFFDM